MAAAMLCVAGDAGAQSVYSRWSNGPSTDPNFFLIGVWYQSPDPSVNNEISGYKAMGINTFVYVDPTTPTAILDDIASAGMDVVTDYTAALVNNKTVIAWFNEPDEPDNAQWNGTTYVDPILPLVQISQYNSVKAEDSTRPVLQNLGQAVAWDGYYGRGSRTGHPEDYPAVTNFTWTNGQQYTNGYLAGCDIGAFDFYPENSTDPVAGQTSLVGYGVGRLKSWSAAGHPVWNYIETTRIDNTSGAPGPTPAQVKAEVWLSLVNGSSGIVYFAHTITPFVEDALLQSKTMNPAVTAINNQVKSLAPELNSPTLASGTIVTGNGTDENVEFMTKALGGNEYLFTVTAQDSGNDTALFEDPSLAQTNATVNVIGENRTISMVNGQFTDTFNANDVHLYEIVGVTNFSPSTTSRIIGKCTMFLNTTGATATVPQGTGYATSTLGTKGKVAIAGKLPDGEAFSTSGTLAGAEFVVNKPLVYPSAGNSKGLLSGTLTFITETGTSDFSGRLTWNRPLQKTGKYQPTFTATLNVIGSFYTYKKGDSVLPGFPVEGGTTYGTLVLSDTSTFTLSKAVNLTAGNILAVTNPGADKLKVIITPSTGVFKGSFQYPLPGGKSKSTDFGGVLFQDEIKGGGFFLGPNGSGSVSLTGT